MYRAFDRKIKDFDESLGCTITITEMIERIDGQDDSKEIVPFYDGEMED